MRSLWIIPSETHWRLASIKLYLLSVRIWKKEFKSTIGARVEKIAEVAYAYQEMEKLPEGFVKPADRTKPWELVMLLSVQESSLQSHLQLSMQMTIMERKHT